MNRKEITYHKNFENVNVSHMNLVPVARHSTFIGRFRGGVAGAAAPLFFVYFQNVFETLTLLYCCLL